MNNKKVFLTGRDYVNWATDDDFNLTKEALDPFVKFVDNVEEADIIHAINWHSLLNINLKKLNKKIMIAHIPHDVRVMISNPDYLRIAPFVDFWIVPSIKAEEYVKLLKMNYYYVPYSIDSKVFYKIDDKEKINNLRAKYNIPQDKYIIGSFQRDTEGADLETPKYLKGPDLFLEIIKNVYRTNKSIHVLLAGPRRYWLRTQFKRHNIPYTFIGEIIENKDDINENTLTKFTINELYNLTDLYIVSSRMEGGPKAILECAASKTKIISTDVGQANDILNYKLVYKNFIDASKIVNDDISSNNLSKFTLENFNNTQSHSIKMISEKWREIYTSIKKKKNTSYKKYNKNKNGIFFNFGDKKPFEEKITFHHKFHKPPWGGGNQFLLALKKEIEYKNWIVQTEFDDKMDKLLFNSFLIDFEKLKKINHKNKLMIHRIDGPTLLVRGKDKEIDDDIFKLNNRIADISVFQSMWSLIETYKMNYLPVNPVLISNFSDSSIFNKNGKVPFNENNKIKIISTSWSSNARKGGPIYQWLDENLDWNKYEYTFVGNIDAKLKNIKIIEPVNSDELAAILKKHDIYITCSMNDPCSNSLIEALSCGLLAIFKNDGGHPEITQYGGLGFNQKEEITNLLEIIVNNYESFQNLAVLPIKERIVDNYTKCFSMVSNG